MTTITRAPATRPRVDHAKPLSFDEHLALAAVEIDSRINPQPYNLADTIRIPVQPTSAPNPYRTPIAALLHRARIRLETDGWTRECLVDEQGRRCPIGAVRVEAASRHQADDACTLLLESIQRHWQAETIPSWNAQQASVAPVLVAFDRATELAHARGI